MDWEKLVKLARDYGLLILTGTIGLSIVGYGLWRAIVPDKPQVEIVKTGQENEMSVVYVDVAGAVEKPGVYKLPSGARIGDALVAAGGLSAEADREWVSQTINLAERVEDGGKMYIPAKSDNQTTQKTGISDKSENQNGRININTAGQSELETLSGIGEVRAKEIINNRPYKATDELVSRAKIPQSIYDKIKDLVTVY